MSVATSRFPGFGIRSLEELLAALEGGSGDEADLLWAAWKLLGAPIPAEIERLLAAYGFLDASLGPTERLFPEARMRGWALSYTSKRGPYQGYLYLAASDGSAGREVRAQSELSKASALVAAAIRARGTVAR